MAIPMAASTSTMAMVFTILAAAITNIMDIMEKGAVRSTQRKRQKRGAAAFRPCLAVHEALLHLLGADAVFLAEPDEEP